MYLHSATGVCLQAAQVFACYIRSVLAVPTGATPAPRYARSFCLSEVHRMLQLSPCSRTLTKMPLLPLIPAALTLENL